MSGTTFIQGGIDPVAYQELVEALAASEARERTLQRLLERAADWIDALAEGTPDEEESEVFIGEIADALGRASLPDAPAPETGPDA